MHRSRDYTLTVAYEFHILEQRTHKYHNNEFSLSQIFISREKTFKNFYNFCDIQINLASVPKFLILGPLNS